MAVLRFQSRPLSRLFCGFARRCVQRLYMGGATIPSVHAYFALPATPARMAVAARPLAGAPLIEVEPAEYRAELAEKEAILAGDHRYYFQALPATEAMQWEALALLLADMARAYPQHFALEVDGDTHIFTNCLLAARTRLRMGDAASLPCAPLDWLGRQVQEDLLLLAPDAGFPLVAGQLCFASRWSLDEKIGQSFAAIHDPVPGFHQQVGRPSALLMERLKAGCPVWRTNWSLAPTGRLDMASKFGAELDALRAGIRAHNCGERCYFRVERQTLSRLPQSGAVLFTIHTYRAPLATLAADPEWARRLLAAVETMPAPFLAYKGIAPYAGALTAYLRGHAAAETR